MVDDAKRWAWGMWMGRLGWTLSIASWIIMIWAALRVDFRLLIIGALFTFVGATLRIARPWVEPGRMPESRLKLRRRLRKESEGKPES